MAAKLRTKNSYIVTVTTADPESSSYVRDIVRESVANPSSSGICIEKVTVIPVGEK